MNNGKLSTNIFIAKNFQLETVISCLINWTFTNLKFKLLILVTETVDTLKNIVEYFQVSLSVCNELG